MLLNIKLMLNFIIFGCWNKYRCDLDKPSKNGMSSVISYLLNQEELPQFYIIAGDNYYPTKLKKKQGKIFNINNFKSGFECILKLYYKIFQYRGYKAANQAIYMIMGNHDLQKEVNLYNINNINTNKNYSINYNELQQIPKLPECIIIDEEMKYKYRFNFDKYFKLLYSEISNEPNTIILFINSMFYTDDKKEIFPCFLKYRHYLEIDNSEMSIDKIIDIEEKYIYYFASRLSKIYNFNNIIIVGHDPIISRRNKIKKPITYLNKQGIHFLKLLYDLGNIQNKYYLCADVHQYQECEIILEGIDIPIKQYVVGTGGTDCDEECIELNILETPETTSQLNGSLIKSFRMIDCSRSFGYLKCEMNDNNLNFIYNKVAECDGLDNHIGGEITKKKTKKKTKNKKNTKKVTKK